MSEDLRLAGDLIPCSTKHRPEFSIALKEEIIAL